MYAHSWDTCTCNEARSQKRKAKDEREKEMEKTWLSQLNEFLQRSNGNYVLTNGNVESRGPPHAPVWKVELIVGEIRSVGVGTTKMEARHHAAELLMPKLVQHQQDNAPAPGTPPAPEHDYHFDVMETHAIDAPSMTIRTVDGTDVECGGSMERLLEAFLESNARFGVDLEGTNVARHYLPYLVQITGVRETWLVRLTEKRYRAYGAMYPEPLRDMFSDENKTKYVFGNDDLGQDARGIVDVQRLARNTPRAVDLMRTMLGRPSAQPPSLCDVATVVLFLKNRQNQDNYVLRFVKDRSITTSNWSAPALSTNQIKYAAMDSRLTLFIGHHLRRLRNLQ